MRQTLCLVVLILLVIPGHASAFTVVDEGVAQVDTALDCGAHRGRVVVRTGVHYQVSELAERRNGISIAFADDTASALECCWVQFVWMEAIVTFQAPNGQVQNRVQLTAKTSGGPVELTTDPNKPKWHVDSAASGSPCYEVEGVSVKDRNGTRTFDQPDDAATELGPQVLARVPAGSVVRVEDVKHFEAYLVCNRVQMLSFCESERALFKGLAARTRCAKWHVTRRARG